MKTKNRKLGPADAIRTKNRKLVRSVDDPAREDGRKLRYPFGA